VKEVCLDEKGRNEEESSVHLQETISFPPSLPPSLPHLCHHLIPRLPLLQRLPVGLALLGSDALLLGLALEEGGREGRKGGREGGREGGKEGGRAGGKEGGREGGREGGV